MTTLYISSSLQLSAYVRAFACVLSMLVCPKTLMKHSYVLLWHLGGKATFSV